jgi:hypothetical protein
MRIQIFSIRSIERPGSTRATAGRIDCKAISADRLITLTQIGSKVSIICSSSLSSTLIEKPYFGTATPAPRILIKGHVIKRHNAVYKYSIMLLFIGVFVFCIHCRTLYLRHS